MKEIEVKFDKLCKDVHNCILCQRMEGSQRVLNRSVGALNAKIMFIGEAPGRLGADDTGVPFHGDKSGHNFEELIEFAGINRSDIYITNAVLCNPKDEKGNNGTPNSSELTNCSTFLIEQINLINPEIIVTLGSNALAATNIIEHHSLSLKLNVRTANKWQNRILIPLYHPGQRAMMSRSMANQRSDYQFVSDFIKKIGTKPLIPTGKSSLNVALIIDYLFSKKDSYTYFAIHKLFYLIEYKSVQKFGKKTTNSYIIRQKDGPYVTDLNLFKLKKALPYLQIRNLSKVNILLYKKSNSLFDERLIDQFTIPDEIKNIIDEVYNEYGNKSNTALKKSVYFTQPMRNILHIENEGKINMYNTPIEFSLESNY